MIVLAFLLNLFAASILLLFAVRFMRTGIERSFGAQLRRLLNGGRNKVVVLASGCFLAILLQGATAVILMISGLVSASISTLSNALVLTIGADIGSAIVIRILSLNLDWLMPFLIVVGGTLFLRSNDIKFRNIGRSILGIALILLSLELLANAASPLRDSNFLPAINKVLEDDYLIAFLVGIAFTFLLHSSVASILVCLMFLESQAISTMVAMSFVLGANIGTSLVPVWLTRSADSIERQLPIINLVIRGFSAIIGFGLVSNFADTGFFPEFLSPVSSVVALHLLFNVCLLIFVPFSDQIEKWSQHFIPSHQAMGEIGVATRIAANLEAQGVSVADPVSVIRRDVSAQLNSVSKMISVTGDLFRNGDTSSEDTTVEQHAEVVDTLDSIRTYFAGYGLEGLGESQQRKSRQLLEYSFRLKQCADILLRRVCPVIQEMHTGQQKLSKRGKDEIEELRCITLANTYLAFEVISTWQSDTARDLVARKEELSRLEQRSKKRHFKRITGQKKQISLETSNLHLELASAYKEINSKIAIIAYLVLSEDGQLANTRLLDTDVLESSS